MRPRPLHAFLVVALLFAAGTGVVAQRYGTFFQRSASSNVKYDGKFTFIRMSYENRNPAWSHDYPLGEQHFMSILTNVSNVNAHVNESSIMSFSDPEIYKNPVIYL